MAAGARGQVITVVQAGDTLVASKAQHVIAVPPAADWLSPIVTGVPFQLLAFHIAVCRGCEVEQLRNLAKPGTAE